MTTKKRTRAARKVRRLVRLCRCEKPSFGLCTPVFLSEEGRAMLEANRPFLGRFVCFHCGGVSKGKPETYDHITGETVIRRLLELGIARKPNAAVEARRNAVASDGLLAVSESGDK